jgi:hypothetical protein
LQVVVILSGPFLRSQCCGPANKREFAGSEII